MVSASLFLEQPQINFSTRCGSRPPRRGLPWWCPRGTADQRGATRTYRRMRQPMDWRSAESLPPPSTWPWAEPTWILRHLPTLIGIRLSEPLIPRWATFQKQPGMIRTALSFTHRLATALTPFPEQTFRQLAG